MGLFSKADDTRLKETLKFIQEVNVDSWERRKLVARGLHDWWENQKKMGGNRPNLLSSAMSQKEGTDAQAKDRNYRRALIMIKSSLFGEDIKV